MKIKTDYDMLTKAKRSKDGVKVSEFMLEAMKVMIPISVTTHLVSDQEIARSLIHCAANTALLYALSYWLSKKYKQDFIDDAKIDLQQLVNELATLEVETSVELLKETKLNKVNYKIEYIDDSKLPELKQYKYIDVPLSNGYEETLLQEHVFGDKNYELSVNKPIKKMNFKTAKK